MADSKFEPLTAKEIILGTDALVPLTQYASNPSTTNPSRFIALRLLDDSIGLFDLATGSQASRPVGSVLYPLQKKGTETTTFTPIAES